MRYAMYLEDQQKINKLSEHEMKRKRLKEEISEGQNNVVNMQKTISRLRKVGLCNEIIAI